MSKLPKPPAGKCGWPWAEEAPQLPDAMPDGEPWPKVSLVTPSYNQGRFIEETIRSVLLQGYPNLEYIVIDGGSSDKTIEIIEKYEQWLTYWVSEPDNGQSHAINKGLNKAAGEIYGWLNSDDYFRSGGLATLVKVRQKHLNCVGWVGGCQEIDEHGKPLRINIPQLGDKNQLGNWGEGAHFYQPSCLFSGVMFTAVGGLDERLEYTMDVDLWIRMAERGSFAWAKEVVSCARVYPEGKTFRDYFMKEAELIAININRGAPKVARRILERNVVERTPREILRDLVRSTIRELGRRTGWT